MWQSKMHKFHLPETIGMLCCGSYRGWLLLTVTATQGEEVFLLNPLTRARVPLPPFATSFKSLNDESSEPYLTELHDSYISIFANCKVTFSADLTDPNCLIILNVGYGVICCRVGDSCWTKVESRLNFRTELEDSTYYNGRFYLLYKGVMSIVELNKPEKEILLEPELQDAVKYFLEGKLGVFIVTTHLLTNNNAYELVPKFGLYEFHEELLNLRLVTNTNNTAIFRTNCSYQAVCSDDWDSLGGGSVYSVIGHIHDNLEHYNVIYSTKIDEDNLKPLVCDLVEEELRVWPPMSAMWFQQRFV